MADAILTHEVRPTGDGMPANTFAEEINEESSGAPRPLNSLELIKALEAIRENRADENHRTALTHGLQVIGEMKRPLEETRAAARRAPVLGGKMQKMPGDMTGTALIHALNVVENLPPPPEPEYHYIPEMKRMTILLKHGDRRLMEGYVGRVYRQQ